LLHNVTGLWLLSEAVRTWEAEDGAPIDLPGLLDAAAAVATDDHGGGIPLFDADGPRLSAPGDMPARIAAVLGESGATVPATREAFTRTIVESIAQAFADAVATAGRLTDRDIDVIHIVGGGALNRLLCQATADRSGLPVLAGPVEATALGNVLVQARAHGWFGPDATLEDLRRVVAASTAPERYEPRR
jgi:rhamnulokinase